MKSRNIYKLLSGALSIVILFVSISIVEGKEVNNKINSYRQYMEATKSLNLGNEKDIEKLNDINNRTTYKVKEVYREKLTEEVNNVLEKGISLPEDKSYFKESFKLSNGNEVIIEMKDSSEELEISPFKTETGHEVHYTGYKDYGARKYETTIFVRSLVDGRLALSTHNHYKIANDGLTVRYADGGVPVVTSPTLRLAKGWYQKITDKRAEKVGYDINVEGYAKAYVVDGYQIPTGREYSLKADVRVKLEALDKTKKRAKVKQHIYATMKY